MHIERTDLVRVTAGSRKNRYPDKPYEDAFWLGSASRAFCVADGITRSRGTDGSYPNPSPASYVATLVASAVASVFNDGNVMGSAEHRVFEALRIANRDIHDYIYGQSGGPGFFNNDVPGAVATILAFEGGFAMFAHLGDCAVVHYPQSDLSSPIRLTIDQTARARQWLTGTTSIAWEAKLEIVRNSIRNVREHPLAFGVLSGEDQGLDFIQTGRVRVTSGDLFLLCSDGLEATLSNLKEDSKLQQLIALRDVEGVMDYAERLDRQLERRSDDKTLLLIDLLG